MPVGDLSARGRNAEEVGARLFLRFPRGPGHLDQIGQARPGMKRGGGGDRDEDKLENGAHVGPANQHPGVMCGGLR